MVKITTGLFVLFFCQFLCFLHLKAQDTEGIPYDTLFTNTGFEHNEVFVVMQKGATESGCYSGYLNSVSISESYPIIDSASTVNKIHSGHEDDETEHASNEFANRYLISPTGYGVKRGEFHWHNVFILYNNISYGITDYITVGIGGIFIPPIALPVFMSAKFMYPVKKDLVNLGVGFSAGSLLSFQLDSELFGMAYGVSTFGNRDRNFTLGLYWNYENNKIRNIPSVSLGSVYKIHNRILLLSDNYYMNFFDSNNFLISLGLRINIEDLFIDIGAFSDEFEPFKVRPWIGFVSKLFD